MVGWINKYMKTIDGWLDIKHMKILMDRTIYEKQMDG